MQARTRRRLAIAGTLVAVAALAAIGGTLAFGSDDGVPDGVRVAGVDVSGLDAAEVEEVVRRRSRELLDEPLEITRTDDPAYRVRVARRSLRAQPRVDEAVQAATEPRSFGGRLLSLVGAEPARDVTIGWDLDPARVGALVRRVTRQVNDPSPRAATLEVTEDDIEVVPGRGGFGVAATELRDRIVAMPEAIALTPGPLDPPIDDEQARAARELALRIVARPVEVTLGPNGVPIEPEVLRSALRFRPEPPALAVGLDPDVLYEDIKAAFSTREQPAREAGFRVRGSELTLITSRTGRALDMEAIAAAIVAAPGTPSVRARFEVTRPERTTAEVRALDITEQVSAFETAYPCCEPRVTNIKRAAELLDGMIIPPGGAFSLNDALGPRTTDRGFVAAPQIAAGRLEDAVGGGVSQVATTMYNAAFFAGLELVAHTPHQFWISRYPKGREATVSFGGPELVFVNDWEAGLLISATATDNLITIRLFSSDLGRRVETETGPEEDIEQPEVIETVNPELEPGAREVVQESGGYGFTISYTRKVWRGDELRRDETFTWTYDPQDAYVEVGPEPDEPDEPDGPRTTPEEPGADEPDGPSEGGGATTPAPAAGTTTGGAAPPP